MITLPAHAESVASRPGLRRVLRPAFRRSPDALAPVMARFRVWDPWKRARIEAIARAFLAGYNAMVAADSLDDVRAVLDPLPPYYRPFAYEGAAMGFGPWAWLRAAGLRAFEAVAHTLSPLTLYQNYVGFGWWLEMLRPGAVAEAAARLDDRYRLIVYEGVGFKTGFLRPQDPDAVRRFDRFDADARHVCYQGWGRSLWFAYMDDLAGAASAISALDPSVHGDCYSGIGLGVAYSMVDRGEALDDVLRLVPAAGRAEFLQGAAFGWEARQLADRPYFDEETSRMTPARRREIEEAVAAVHHSRNALEAAGTRAAFYQQWRALTRQAIERAGLFAR